MIAQESLKAFEILITPANSPEIPESNSSLRSQMVRPGFILLNNCNAPTIIGGQLLYLKVKGTTSMLSITGNLKGLSN